MPWGLSPELLEHACSWSHRERNVTACAKWRWTQRAGRARAARHGLRADAGVVRGDGEMAVCRGPLGKVVPVPDLRMAQNRKFRTVSKDVTWSTSDHLMWAPQLFRRPTTSTSLCRRIRMQLHLSGLFSPKIPRISTHPLSAAATSFPDSRPQSRAGIGATLCSPCDPCGRE